MTEGKEHKPILVIRFPVKAIDAERLQDIVFENLQKKMKDYHVIGLKDNDVDRIEFECYNAPHAESDFSELREEIIKKVESSRDTEEYGKTINERVIEEIEKLRQERIDEKNQLEEE